MSFVFIKHITMVHALERVEFCDDIVSSQFPPPRTTTQLSTESQSQNIQLHQRNHSALQYPLWADHSQRVQDLQRFSTFSRKDTLKRQKRCLIRNPRAHDQTCSGKSFEAVPLEWQPDDVNLRRQPHVG